MFGSMRLGLGLSPTKGGGAVDYLANWVAASTWADFNAKMLDRQFQESTGQTAVTASADKVGLWFDGAQWGGQTLTQVLAAQPNTINDPTFATWTQTNGTGADVNVTGGSINFTNTTVSNVTMTGATTGLGTSKFFELEFEVFDWAAGTVTIFISNGGGTIINLGSGNGVKRAIVTATATQNILVRAASIGSTFSVRNLHLKEIPGYAGLNATPSQRLNLLIASTRYTLTGDGTDDNLLTTWFAGSGGNTIFFDVDVPASLPGIVTFFGSNDATPTRLRVGVDAAGRLCAAVGAQGETTIVGSVDYRGQRLVGALTQDGSLVKLFTLAGGEVYSAAQSGLPCTAVAARLCAGNSSGTAVSFFAGGIGRIIPVRKGGLLISDWLKIGPQLAAAGA